MEEVPGGGGCPTDEALKPAKIVAAVLLKGLSPFLRPVDYYVWRQ
jgi:hypothetical protein